MGGVEATGSKGGSGQGGRLRGQRQFLGTRDVGKMVGIERKGAEIQGWGMGEHGSSILIGVEGIGISDRTA